MSGKIFSLNTYIQKANIIHNNKYDYSLTEYTGSKNKIKIICPIHGIFEQRASDHLSGNECPKCGLIKMGAAHKYTTEIFIQQAVALHGDKYNYSLTEYLGARKKVKIICNLHKITFEQTPHHHLSGNGGCPQCRATRNIEKSLKCQKDFIKEIIDIYGETYDYSQTIYTGGRNKINVICPYHGLFTIIAHNHLNGAGCPKCGKIESILKHTLTTNDFIKMSREIHGNKYDYSKSEYIGTFSKITIGCPIHGFFDQKAHIHLRGSGCPICVKSVSNIEIEWLDFIQVPKEYRRARLKINGKTFKPDAYNPNTNTIYEFYGDFWHGNPKIYDPNKINNATKNTFGELYSKTIIKENILKQAGYNVVSIWENDFKELFKKAG